MLAVGRPCRPTKRDGDGGTERSEERYETSRATDGIRPGVHGRRTGTAGSEHRGSAELRRGDRILLHDPGIRGLLPAARRVEDTWIPDLADLHSRRVRGPVLSACRVAAARRAGQPAEPARPEHHADDAS